MSPTALGRGLLLVLGMGRWDGGSGRGGRSMPNLVLVGWWMGRLGWVLLLRGRGFRVALLLQSLLLAGLAAGGCSLWLLLVGRGFSFVMLLQVLAGLAAAGCTLGPLTLKVGSPSARQWQRCKKKKQ